MGKGRKRSTNGEETIEEKIRKDQRRQELRLKRLETARQTNWERIDLNTDTYALRYQDGQQEFASSGLNPNYSFGQIFLKFLPPDFVEEVWNYYPISTWKYGNTDKGGTINKGRCPTKLIYISISIYILICGYQNAPKENKKNNDALKISLESAIKLIRDRRPGIKVPGINIVKAFISRYHIPKEFYKDLSRRFTEVINNPGRIVAGDEKLLRFLGDSSLIRQIPTKPDQVGFWFYELMCKIDENSFYILYTRVQDSCPAIGQSIETIDIVREWGSICKSFQEKNNNQGPILVSDSYYATEGSREWCKQENVKYIMAVQTNRFPILMEAMKLKGDPVTKPGESAAIVLPETGEVFAHHWDPDVNIDKKYVLSNAFYKVPNTRRSALAKVPVYPYYKITFSLCDRFNRGLHDKKFCHRTGGGGRYGENGHIHKFFMACIIKNTLTLRDINCSDEEKNKDFLLKCVELAFDIIDLTNDF